jgi:hypothetical protein
MSEPEKIDITNRWGEVRVKEFLITRIPKGIKMTASARHNNFLSI